ncbi:iron-siderophore ABC transporter substrate-binding protein [Rhodococcus sp. IEGM 1366]|uniref:ABC transporter substrate-binding protein n=1 Tax=Rhodococcus sp. IEGM 1366 TaxID=3082223 RepID=UPI0029549E6E|nr:iron-siderophore ABC transporter substrate-binding protein [Rhodococcus sp. IEGM 1366]MDV8065967.1 iron-siderophore ABC transporter substrate-binding protein [Rhodococcus sp. IEGM 1366]
MLTRTSFRTRTSVRIAMVALATVFAATACGTSDAGSNANGNTDVATGGKLFSTADTETAKLGSDSAPGEFPRTVTHALGEVTLETKPTRVVVLDSGELDEVLSLGITPVGIASPESAAGQPSYLADKLVGVPDVGTTNNLNLEAITALKPDLILGSKLRQDKLYPQLSAIAPTVFSIRPGFPWKENFLLAGDALGEETKAEQILNDYQTHADEVRASIDGSPTISLVRFMSGKLRLYGNLSFIGVILKDVGLPRPAIQDIDELAVEVSPETITQAEGDQIFYSSYGSPADTGQTTVTAGPLWATMDAVKDGRASEVSDETWFLGLGPTGANLVLEDLEAKLGK